VPTDSEVSYSGAIDVDDDSDLEEQSRPTKSKYKKGDGAERKRPPLERSGSAADSHNFLLTAAEQRALEKKSDKKEKEDPFLFLQDIRDVND
jgi:DNA mismatch repair protein MSH6